MNVTLNEKLVSYSEWLAKLAQADLSPNGTYKVLHVTKSNAFPYGEVIFQDSRLGVQVIRLVDLETWRAVQNLLGFYGPIFQALVITVENDNVRLTLSDSPGVIVPTSYGWSSY
jgi:hypothetical protein